MLVTDGSDNAEIERARDAARKTDVPLKVLKPDQKVIADLYGAGYAFIRPNQHVAWRANSWPRPAATGRCSRSQRGQSSLRDAARVDPEPGA